MFQYCKITVWGGFQLEFVSISRVINQKSVINPVLDMSLGILTPLD